MALGTTVNFFSSSVRASEGQEKEIPKSEKCYKIPRSPTGVE